jgi:hypothetical protein
MLVKIKGTVITAQYGALSDGTLLRTSDEFAKHLVEEANAAEYMGTETLTEEPKLKEAPLEKKRGRPAKE